MKSDLQFWFRVDSYCWNAFLIYWIASALKWKAAKRQESPLERMGQIVPMAAAYTLLFAEYSRYGALGARFVPAYEAFGIVGTIVTVAGTGLAIWARVHLGTNWSATVSIRADHELIHTGPYSRIRHPIYTGILLAFAGTVLTLGEVRGAIAFGIVLTAFYFKARKEERFLKQEFGEPFAEHVGRTGMFLPRSL